MRNLNKYMQIVITAHHNYYLGRQLSHQQGEEKSFRSLSLMAMRLSGEVVRRSPNIWDMKNKWGFLQTQQSRFASILLDGVLGPTHLARHTWQRYCISLVPESTHEASWGPLKGAVSAQKALCGPKTNTRELLGGTIENSISKRGGIDF